MSRVLHFAITIKTLHEENYLVFLKCASRQKLLLSDSKIAGGWFCQQHPGWHYARNPLEYKQYILEMYVRLFI